MKRKDLLSSREYAVSQFQLALLNTIGEYKKNKKLKDTQLADELGVSKSYISQLLNVTFDHKISKVVDLAMACNKMPLLFLVDLDTFIEDDSQGKYYDLLPMYKPSAVSFSEQSENTTTEVKKLATIEYVFQEIAKH